MIVVLFALKELKHLPVNSHIRVFSDNSPVVYVLKRRGSAKSKPLNNWALSIFKLLRKRQWFISVHHIAGKSNVWADQFSRSAPISTEWELDVESFSWISHLTHRPQIDLFATRENRKLNNFISPFPDHLALGIDAFTIDWNRWTCIYLFPPTNLILKVLENLMHFEGTAIIVAPLWPRAPWFHLLSSITKPFKIPNPVLSQIVQGVKSYDTSVLTKHLHAWIY